MNTNEEDDIWRLFDSFNLDEDLDTENKNNCKNTL